MTSPRDVTAKLEVYVYDPTEIEMQITVAKLPGLELTEDLTVTLDDKPVEVEEIVPTGSLDPDHIHTPGVYVDRIVKTIPEKRIEQRTTRQRPEAAAAGSEV